MWQDGELMLMDQKVPKHKELVGHMIPYHIMLTLEEASRSHDQILHKGILYMLLIFQL